MCPQVRCLNEATEGSAQNVFRAWDKRLEAPETPLESNDGDPELLLHVPFEGAAKVKALCVIGTLPASAVVSAPLEPQKFMLIQGYYPKSVRLVTPTPMRCRSIAKCS